jgi:hypothetical protein
MRELEYSQPVTRPFFLTFILLFTGFVSIAATPVVAPAPGPVAAPAPSPPPKSVVYCMADDSSITDFKENPAAVRRMVDDVVMATTDTNDVASAWRSLVKPGDKVGIKISAAGGKYFSTHRSVVEAIVDGLESAGIARKDVIVWDRDGLANAGYFNRPGGYQVRSIASAQDYDPDPKIAISSAVPGKLIWGDVDFSKKDPHQNPLEFIDRDQMSSDSHICKILTQNVTKIINVPVFSSSETAGVAGALYNVTVPNVDNWRRFSDNDSFICDLYSDPHIGPKVVINIMDGLIAQYAGGPEFQPNYAVRHGMIYASKDPVAIDAIALGQIEHWRQEAKLPPIAPYAAYLLTAASMGIGAVLPERIELRMLQVQAH